MAPSKSNWTQITRPGKGAPGGCIAFSQGKNETLACRPCEADPQAQKLWLGWIDRLIEAGVDGVDIRISAHGSLTDEPWDYGFNPSIAEEYRERFGEELLGAGYHQERLARLRGDHYTRFSRKPADGCRLTSIRRHFDRMPAMDR